MENLSFKVSSRTAILMGRENIGTDEGALIELVKNAYDADSSFSIISFEKDSILIIDNGEGMNDETIKNKWMIIGTDNKLSDAYSKNQRIKSGAKGIGRFALDKLGKKTKVITSPSPDEVYEWNVSWEDFEIKNQVIDEVKATLDKKTGNLKDYIIQNVENVAIKEFIKKREINNGTFIKISELRSEWTDEKLNSIFNNFQMLIPSQNKVCFDLYFGEIPQKFTRVNVGTYKDYDFRMNVKFDGLKDCEVKISREEFNSEALPKEFFDMEEVKKIGMTEENFSNTNFEQNITTLLKLNNHEKYIKELGKFEFDICFLKLSKGSTNEEKYYYRHFESTTRKNFMNKYGGVKIYRDNFRVRPYGEKSSSTFDWLGLGQRQASSPEAISSRAGSWKVRPNNIIGNIKISRMFNLNLEDKSSREGILETEHFYFFKRVILSCIKILEDDRQFIFRNLGDLHKIKNHSEEKIREGEELLKKLKKDPKENEPPKLNYSYEEFNKEKEKANVLAGLSIAIKEKNEELMDENKILRTYASSGLMLSSLSHEVKNILCKEIGGKLSLVQAIISEYKNNIDKEDFKDCNELIDELKTDTSTIETWVNFSLNLLKKDKRKRRQVLINEFGKEIEKSWQIILKKYNASLKIGLPNKYIKFTCFKSDLESIIVNLIVNSLDAFQKNNASKTREIKINFEITLNNKFLISYEDTGPGLDKIIKKPEEIFKSNFTTKVDEDGKEKGTGIGMNVVKNIIDDYKGTVVFPEYRKNFKMEIILPLEKKGDGFVV